jgi:hypothetical protein
MTISSRARCFTLSDALILIVTTAIGLALWRPHFEYAWMELNRRSTWDVRWYWLNLSRFVNFLVPWSLALLMLSLRQPRPQLRRVVLRPAAIVGIVVLVGLGIWVVLFLFAGLVKGESSVRSLGGASFRVSLFLPLEVALSLVSFWLVHLIGRGHRMKAHWLDWMGWALGCSWVVLGLSSQALSLLALP